MDESPMDCERGAVAFRLMEDFWRQWRRTAFVGCLLGVESDLGGRATDRPGHYTTDQVNRHG